MAVQKIAYAAKTAIVWTGTSLANAAARQSTVVDNTVNLYDDAIVQVQSNGIAAATATLDFYVYAALSDTTYSDGATGTDGTFTAANRLNAVWIGSVTMNAAVAVNCTLPKSVAACFGGIMPSKWGLIGVNNAGAALSAPQPTPAGSTLGGPRPRAGLHPTGIAGALPQVKAARPQARRKRLR